MTKERWRRASSYPKVLITVRSELLSSNKEYRRSFLPVEPHDTDKDEEHEAKEFFQVGIHVIADFDEFLMNVSPK